MSARRRLLLTYDIREPKRLRRVHKVAKEFGYALQYSVFVCDLDAIGRLRLEAAVRDVMHEGVDSVALFDLGESDGRGVECVRQLGARIDLPTSGGTAIW